jgi:type IV secretory pathway VirB10-like protein
LRTLASEKDRLHVNYSIFDQNSINGKFIAKKTMRDNKNKKRIHTVANTSVAGNDDDEQRSQTAILDAEENAPNLAETPLLKPKAEYPKGKDTKSMPRPEPVQKNAPTQSQNKQQKKKEEPRRQESDKKASKHRHDDSGDEESKTIV